MVFRTSLLACILVLGQGLPAWADYSCNGNGPLTFSKDAISGAKLKQRAFVHNGTVAFKSKTKFVFFGSGGKVLHTGARTHISPDAVASANVRLLDDTHSCDIGKMVQAVTGS